MSTRFVRPTAILIGGGTGGPNLLKCLRSRLPQTRLAIVCPVTDSGRSTGIARRLLGTPAPGDLRHSLSTLTDDPNWGRLMELRLQGTPGDDLEGMAVGNLVLGALAQSLSNIGTATSIVSRLASVTETV